MRRVVQGSPQITWRVVQTLSYLEDSRTTLSYGNDCVRGFKMGQTTLPDSLKNLVPLYNIEELIWLPTLKKWLWIFSLAVFFTLSTSTTHILVLKFLVFQLFSDPLVAQAPSFGWALVLDWSVVSQSRAWYGTLSIMTI